MHNSFRLILCVLRKCLFASVIFLSLHLTYADNWNITKSTHFLVYYKSCPEDFIRQLIDKSEGYYDKIASGLGFTRFNFWLWDNRAKIYIYDNLADYQSATGQPEWSAGCSIVREKVIKTYPYAKDFFETILPHEMGHIIFREFVGFDNSAIPLWLDEGVASYQEKSKFMTANKIIKEAIEGDKFIDLAELSRLDPRLMLDTSSVKLFYAEALSLIHYLVKEFGSESFVLFCQNLRDKRDLERAIAATYPFSNIQELDRAWRRHLATQ